MKQYLDAIKHNRKMLLIFIIIMICSISVICVLKPISLISFAIDGQSAKASISAELRKYVNYAISEENKGTILEYRVNLSMDYGDNQEFIPIKDSKMTINVNQIDGKYPQNVKVISESTEVTNGKQSDIIENYLYDSSNGTITIYASNINKDGEIISSVQPNSDSKDSYIIICNYDTYTDTNKERELMLEILADVTVNQENTETIHSEKGYKANVTENIEKLTSSKISTEDVYNGYLKSNILNGTNYTTQYKETNEISISKKEAQQKLKITERNTFLNINKNENDEEIENDLGNHQNLLYKETKFSRENIISILGEAYALQILDEKENVIAIIDGNTEFDENGMVTITYPDAIESIILKTSEVINEGILYVENTKEISDKLTNIENLKIKTTTELTGIREEIIVEETQEESPKEIVQEIQTFSHREEEIIEIKNASTDITLDIDNTRWTNEYQNEVTFNVYLNAQNVQKNMYKNPQIKIELPNQVKKVVLSDSFIIYGNGLELTECYVETEQDGSLNIVGNIIGSQTQYMENSLGLVTDLKISATVILNGNIESTVENVKLSYTNGYTLDGTVETGNREVEIEVNNYEQKVESVSDADIIYDTAEPLAQYSGQLQLEVAPVKGDTNISNGDIVYEGEYIKYNIKVTNLSDAEINNIRLVATIPEGVTYGELEADYYSYLGKYAYNFDQSVRSKEIQIGTIGAGQSVSQFYEVKVDDLLENTTEREMISVIKAFVGEEEVANYTLTNTVKEASVQVFLSAQMDNARDRWNYNVDLIGEEGKEVTLEVKLPKEFEATHYVLNGVKIYFEDEQISEDNVVILTITIPTEGQETDEVLMGASTSISIQGWMDPSEIEEETENSEIQLTAVATVTEDGTSYKSNENRIMLGYESVSIEMTSETEGEEIKYDDEIYYHITVTNTGRTNLNNPAYSTITVNVTDYLPENVNPDSMTYQGWEQDVIITHSDGTKETITYTELQELINNNSDIQSFEPTDNFYRKEMVTEDIKGILTDAEGNKLPNIDLYFNIPYGESVTIDVKATAGMVYEKTKIENSANVTGDRIDSKTSNKISHIILPYNYEEPDPENPDPENPDPENPDPENPDPENPDPENPDPENPNPENPDQETYSISGVAWLDENEDGRRQTDEPLLEGIRTILINSSAGNKVGEISTQSDGSYTFQNLVEGNYFIAFEYDKGKYSITQYKKNGVSNDTNSDVTSKAINLDGEQLTVGLTDVINLDASVSHIDIGLIENKICDLKLDKYIDKIIVKTIKGTREINYDNATLAKLEIRSKEIEGATIAVTYKIVITNEGEISATVENVRDYLPEGLKFSSELNKNWTQTSDGYIRSLNTSNTQIAPGESIELTLVATKVMTSDETGTYTNGAEIGKMTSVTGATDRDSIPGNRVQSEDDYAKADLIISISTGGVFIGISIIIVAFVILAICIYLNRKFGWKKISKLSLFLLIFLALTTSQCKAISEAYLTTIFWDIYQSNGMQTPYFSGGPSGEGGYCVEHGVWAYSGYYDFSYAIFSSSETIDNGANVDFEFSKVDTNINMRVLNSNYNIYGPFQIQSSEPLTQFGFWLYNSEGQGVTYFYISDANGTPIDGLTGNDTFYLCAPTNQCANGISRFRIGVTKTGTKTTTTNMYGYLVYKSHGEIYHIDDAVRPDKYPNGSWNTQDVIPYNLYIYDQTTNTEELSNTQYVEWTNFNGELEIIKQDKDNSNIKLPGVQIRVENQSAGYNKVFTTDSNGRIVIDNLPKGTYKITEISNGNYGYTTVEQGQTTLYDGEVKTFILYNTKQTGNLKIRKVDKDNNNIVLSNVTFRIKDSSGRYIKAIDENGKFQSQVTGSINLGNLQTTTNESESTLFKTDNVGNLQINNLLTDTYEIIEISNPYYGYTVKPTNVKVNVVRAQTTSKVIENVKQTGNLKVEKVDANNNSIPLPGVSFKIKNSSGQYIIAIDHNGSIQKTVTGTVHLSNIQTTTNINNATEFITDTDGNIRIYNLLCGTYNVVETSIGNNFGYELNDAYITWEGNLGSGSRNIAQIRVDRQTSTNTSTSAGQSDSIFSILKVKNKRVYIKISGYAWEEKTDGKNSTKDYVWNNGTEDKRLQNVTVRLKKADGIILAQATTNVNGEYIFGNYDVNPNAVKIKIDDLVGAYVEFEYNGMGYETIPVDTSKDNGNKAADEILRKTFNNNYAIISKGISSNSNGNKIYDINYNTINYTSIVNYGDNIKYGYTGQTYPISGVDSQYIIQAITQKKTNNILYTNYTVESIRSYGIIEISNINLGVEEREMPDLAITQDMDQVQISLNDYTHIYNYEQRFENPNEFAGGDGFNVTVKFANKYLNNSYSREVYSSDIVYNKQPGNAGKLKVFVTYKIRLRNESSNLYSTIRTLSNYYDSRYENIVVKDANGRIIQSSIDDNYQVDGMKRLNIQLNQQIAHGQTQEITITYELNNAAINSILNGNVTLHSVTEITSYSTYSNSEYSEEYAGIDIDSAPDNTQPTNINTFEDDTDRAPSLILNVKEGRAIQGKVWEDSAIQELLGKTGYEKERKGNGIFETTENLVNNVQVDLMTIDDSGNVQLAKLYRKDGTVVNASVKTSGRGDYSLVGVIPSKYILRYTYGDNSVIVDTNGNVIKNVNADNYKSTIYRGGNKANVENMTDYWYSGEISNTGATRWSDAKDNDAIIDERTQEEDINYQTVTTGGDLTQVSADTRRFEIVLDYDVNPDNASNYGENLVFEFNNIDFGIIERPRQSLLIHKQVSHVRITLTNGTNVIDGDPRSQNLSGVRVLDDDVYIEIDNEIIQGATLKITYEIIVDNSNCEIDYNNEDYYIYGTVPTGNANWKIATVVDMFDYLPEEVVLESNEDNNWERIYITEDMKNTLLSEKIYEVVKGYQNIIHLKNPIFENMEPGSESIDTSMVVTKQLSSTSDDLTYENDIEVIKLKGRKPINSIPGNYNPTTNQSYNLETDSYGGDETDDDHVEVTITAPTGENRQYGIYGMIAISVLVIIGVGIIIIKKKVLNK